MVLTTAKLQRIERQAWGKIQRQGQSSLTVPVDFEEFLKLTTIRSGGQMKQFTPYPYQLLLSLTPKQYRALVHLAAGGSNKEAADASGVAVRTIESWKAKPEFQRMLGEATVKLFDMALAELVLGAQDAAKELRSIIKDEETPARIKVSAINTLLTNAAKVKDWALEARLENVEALLSGSDNSEAPEA